MYLGIEIGGTKLQLGIGTGASAEIAAWQRRDVDIDQGAEGILEQIREAGARLSQGRTIERIGVGFGGPVHSDSGRIIKSHQVAGWDDFPLGDWCQQTFGVPAQVGNDCDVAALAEATNGAGKGARTVFYVTVGTGIGGGLVIHGHLHGQGRPAASEIGHLRPGPGADTAQRTVESLASGLAIGCTAQERVRQSTTPQDPAVEDLRSRCGGQLESLSAKQVGEAAVEGNALARQVLRDSCRVLGWAIAQTITLLAPQVIVVGGGVSLIGETHFFQPLREEVARYVFPPLAGSYQILPAQLGELVVVHGALTLAQRTA
jgi:glucokinase